MSGAHPFGPSAEPTAGPRVAAASSFSETAFPGSSAFGPTDARSENNGPATWMLYLGLLIPLATLPLLMTEGWPAHVIGWFLAIAGSLGFLTAFTIVDLRRRAKGSYADKPGLLAGLRIAVIVVGIVVAGIQIYPVAEIIARSDWAA